VSPEARPDWGVDSEYGRLREVLLCRPDHFRWLPTSDISRATLESGRRYDQASAARQHVELVSAYEQAGVRCHFLEPDPALPYQVFARDSSAMTPWGPVILQLRQWWRRGEYAPAIRFYEAAGMPIFRMVTAAALEGGDVMLVEPGSVLIGTGEGRSQEPAARQLAGWFEEKGWEARIETVPSRYVHIDVLVAILAERLAAVCTEIVSPELVAWLREKRFELIEVPADDAFLLGVNAVSLGGERVLSSAGASTLNRALRASGLEVLEPELETFTLGGGGAHCLGQALRRERAGG
jgi:N-dimethylarginine dimethylaminohydrolase